MLHVQELLIAALVILGGLMDYLKLIFNFIFEVMKLSVSSGFFNIFALFILVFISIQFMRRLL